MEPADLASLLTGQERRVAFAVGHGATNKAVARELSISIKTVEFHLGNVYRKLSIASRTELAHAIGRRSERSAGRIVQVGNLGRERSVLIGRERLLADVVKLLKVQRLVTLTGVGGVGKTSLARHAAAQIADGFRDGVWIVELASLRAGADVATATSIALGLVERGAPTAQDVADRLRYQQRLVLLDNCEHVLGDAARVAAAIVRSCPDVVVLATSRERLDIAGEDVLIVPPLDLDGVDEPSAAVRLFVERATSVHREFAPAGEEWEVVDALCRRLDGLPLAIELAAARAVGLGVGEILDRVDDRFRLLTRRRDTEGTHHSLLRTIEWSYDLLSAGEQRVFESLSVFAGDFDLLAATAVASGTSEPGDVADDVAALVDKSMVVVVLRNGARRYRLLDTLRDYARARLRDRGEEAAAVRRHLDHFCRFARHIDEVMWAPDELVFHRALVDDWHNVRSAMSTACDLDDAQTACELLDHVYLWSRTRLRNEVGDWAERIRHLPSATEFPDRVTATAIAAACAWNRGHAALAQDLLATARDEENRFGPTARPWVPLIAVDIDGPPHDRADAQETQARARAAGNELFEFFGLMQETLALAFSVAFSDVTVDQAAAHIAWIRNGVDVAERLRIPEGIGVALMALGMALQQTEPDRAVALLERSLAIAQPLELELAASIARFGLITTLARSGRYDDSLEVAINALQASLRTGTATDFADLLALCVSPLVKRGKHELALLIVSVVTTTAHRDGVAVSAALPSTDITSSLALSTAETIIQRGRSLSLADVVVEVLGWATQGNPQ